MVNKAKGPWFDKGLEYVMSYTATLREREVILNSYARISRRSVLWSFPQQSGWYVDFAAP
jgi:hypothetical protein